jgi:hypothetical protein
MTTMPVYFSVRLVEVACNGGTRLGRVPRLQWHTATTSQGSPHGVLTQAPSPIAEETRRRATLGR